MKPIKNLFISAAVAALACLGVSAQELQVKSFNADPSDISAVVYQVPDANQNPCALIKVSIPGVQNPSFEGDIVKTEAKGNETWVYMPGGSSWLNIKSDSHLPLRYSFDTPLEANTTYLLNVIPQKAAAAGTPDLGERFTVTLAPQTSASIGGVAVEQGEPVKFDMIKVKSGRFQMGATPDQESVEQDENPVRWVVISKDFFIGETEVTQELWEYVMGNNPSELKDPQNPVENISWKDAQDFITALNRLTKVKFRLPTEAEWEYCARGGHKTNHYKFAGADDPSAVGWWFQNCSNRTQPVKSKQPNELGLYDMSGNVWELCEDYKNDYRKDDVNDPLCTSPQKAGNRVRRGGAWNSQDVNEMRNAYRKRIPETNRNNATGLRLVLVM